MGSLDRPAFGPRRREASPVRVAVVAQWCRFAAVGGANTLLSWCLYAVLEHAGVGYLLASGLAFAAGALSSYALNRRWTFGSHAPAAPEARRFVAVQCVGLALDVMLLRLLVDGIGIHHLIAQALVFPFASAATFGLSRRWVFAVRPTRARWGAPGGA